MAFRKLLDRACPCCNNVFRPRLAKSVFCSNGCSVRQRYKTTHAPAWRGGIQRRADRYVKQAAKQHPNADKRGYMWQHRLVMEQVLGRILEKRERVHHKNGVRDDNRPENLELWTLTLKDPSGARAIDIARDRLSKLTPEDRATLFKEMQ